MIGVVIVTYCSSDVIAACLDSLMCSERSDMRIILCDNASPDDTVAVIRAWGRAHPGYLSEIDATDTGYLCKSFCTPITLMCLRENRGFAGGVNAGLRVLLAHPQVSLFWLLNPDSEVLPDTAAAYERRAAEAGPFALMGGRTIYHEAPNLIQSDGGRINRWTGICHNVNQGREPGETMPPDPRSLDFISGANVVASRTFIEYAGLMREDYFLYWEEVDWAARRGDMPLILCPDAIVYHHGGTAIGTGSITRRASGFANYFNCRNRMIFMCRFYPWTLPAAYVFSVLKIIKLLFAGALEEAGGAWRGLNQMAPGANIRNRLEQPAAEQTFRESRIVR
ncbi:MAG: glycosyltransferase family 2 protein [Bradyrhizobium sp.]|nr:glycosyltransferase family 2 protein [Bradyrhizobium sp.]